MIMKKALLLIAAALAPSTSASDKVRTTSVECTFEKPRGVALRDGKFKETSINFRDQTTPWTYVFEFEKVEPGHWTDVTITADTDFANIAGTFQALAVAPDTYVLNILTQRGCMFSSQICGGYVQLTNIEADEAAVSLKPISYYGDQKSGARFFHVDLFGKCSNSNVGEDAA